MTKTVSRLLLCFCVFGILNLVLCDGNIEQLSQRKSPRKLIDPNLQRQVKPNPGQVQPVGAQGQHAGIQGQLVGAQGQHAGAQGQPARAQGQHAGAQGQPAGVQGQLAGAQGQPAGVQDQILHGHDAIQQDANNAVHRLPDAQPQAQGKPNGQRALQLDNLANHPKCVDDISRICRGKKIYSNLDVLTCLNEKNVEDEDISSECHHVVWNFKLNITTNPKFENIARQVCQQAIKVFDCASDKSGHILSCLLENKDKVEVVTCKAFLKKISSIVFSDYRLICNFIADCQADIQNYHCGRVGAPSSDEDDIVSHTQGEVINCLEDKLGDGGKLDSKCELQIERIAELSAEDYNLDKNLFYKCRDMRDRLCDHVVAGEGRVYKCLFNHKYSSEMSSVCRDAISVRQKLISKDYKASHRLNKGCRQDITKHCHQSVIHNANDQKDLIGLSTMMLCLEEAKLRGETLSVKCENQLIDFRKMLMENFELSAEVMHDCAAPIRDHCGGEIEKQETLHCLMGLAESPPEVKSESEAEEQVPALDDRCQHAIMNLIKETEVASDYKMDTVLATSCSDVIASTCNQFHDGDPLILSCLMEQLYTPRMNLECEKHLLELQYFISRDFFLDPAFHKRCKADAEKYCTKRFSLEGGGQNPDDVQDGDSPPTLPFNLVLSCLHRHNDGQNPILSPSCQQEVHRMLKQRALDFHLNPDLESACRASLGKFCSEDVPERGKELICLQDHYENLTSEACRTQIQSLTNLESQDAANLENILISACEPMLQKYCKAVLDTEDEGKVMECLIKHKDEMESKECAAGILHFQLIEMKDYHFNYRFLKACKNDINNICVNPKPSSKADVVLCLSKEVRDPTLHNKPSRVSAACRQQLTAENLQMHENVKLNPEVDEACRQDYAKYCSDVKPGKARVIECLRNAPTLSKKCRKKIGVLQKNEADDQALDFNLMRTCKNNIKSFCMSHLETGDHQNIVNCLMFYRKKLDEACKELLFSRRKEMFENIQLNPELMNSCKKDIARHCKVAVKKAGQEQENGELPDGPVYDCLKKVASDNAPKRVLSPNCDSHLSVVFAEQQEDFRLDPQLMLKCISSIKEFCDDDDSDNSQNVVECLKGLYMDGTLAKSTNPQCAIEVAVLINAGRSDIESDPVLHESCASDVNEYCAKIQPGNGNVVTCLLNNLNILTPQCQEEMNSRQQMWNKALNKVDSLSGLSNQIMTSSNSSYLLSVITIMAVGILLLGTMCGRITKRAGRDRKMR